MQVLSKNAKIRDVNHSFTIRNYAVNQSEFFVTPRAEKLKNDKNFKTLEKKCEHQYKFAFLFGERKHIALKIVKRST